MRSVDSENGSSSQTSIPPTNWIFNEITKHNGNIQKLSEDWWVEYSSGNDSAISDFIELFFHFSGVFGFEYDPEYFPGAELPVILGFENCVTGPSSCLNPQYLQNFKILLTLVFSSREFDLLLKGRAILEKVKSTMTLLMNGMSLLTLIIEARSFIDRSGNRSVVEKDREKQALLDLHNWLKKEIAQKTARDVSSKVRVRFIEEVKVWAMSHPHFALSSRWREMILWAVVDREIEIRMAALTTLRILIQSDAVQQKHQRELFNSVKHVLTRILSDNRVADLVVQIFNGSFKRGFVSDIDDATWIKIYKCVFKEDKIVAKAAAEFITVTRLDKRNTNPVQFLKHLAAFQRMENKGRIADLISSFFDVIRETVSLDHWVEFVKRTVIDDKMDASAMTTHLNLFCGYLHHTCQFQKNSEFDEFFRELTRVLPDLWFQLIKFDKIAINADALAIVVEIISFTDKFLTIELRCRVMNAVFQICLETKIRQVIRACFKSLKRLTKNVDRPEVASIIDEKRGQFCQTLVEYLRHDFNFFSAEPEMKWRFMEFAKLFELPSSVWDDCAQIYRDLSVSSQWTESRIEVFETVCDVLFAMIMVPYAEVVRRTREFPESLIEADYLIDECALIMSRIFDFQEPLRGILKKKTGPFSKAYFALADVIDFFGPHLAHHSRLWTCANAIYPDVLSLVLQTAENASKDHVEDGELCCRVFKRALNLISNESIEIFHLNQFLLHFGAHNEKHSLMILECMKTYSGIKSSVNSWKLASVLVSYFLEIMKVSDSTSRRVDAPIKKIKDLIVWWDIQDPERLSIRQDTLVAIHEMVLDVAKILMQSRVLKLIPCLHPLVRIKDSRPLLNLLEKYKDDEFVFPQKHFKELEQMLTSLSMKHTSAHT